MAGSRYHDAGRARGTSVGALFDDRNWNIAAGFEMKDRVVD
jgi:hypothetical protein